jgi:hypothetical protein
MPVRYVGSILFTLVALLSVGLIVTSGTANAAATVAPAPVVPPPGGATLTQTSAGTWTASVYLDTAALCGDTFNLVTGAPDTDKPATAVTYDGSRTAPCAAAQAAQDGAVTMVGLTFPALPDGSIPQTATLVVTPSAASLAAGAPPVEFALTVRRQLTGSSSLWVPVWFGLAFVVLLVVLVMIIGIPATGNRRVRGPRPSLFKATLYAPSAWTFGGSWATNFTALGTVIGGVLTATGAVSGIVPGVDLSRIGLLFAVFGVFAVIAPLVFATLNARLSGTATARGDGEGPATNTWIMVVASSFTAFGMGSSIGLIGWVLTYRLVVAPWQVRLCVGIGIGLVAIIFLGNACTSIVVMANRSQQRTVHRRATAPPHLATEAAHLATELAVRPARPDSLL